MHHTLTAPCVMGMQHHALCPGSAYDLPARMLIRPCTTHSLCPAALCFSLAPCIMCCQRHAAHTGHVGVHASAAWLMTWPGAEHMCRQPGMQRMCMRDAARLSTQRCLAAALAMATTPANQGGPLTAGKRYTVELKKPLGIVLQQNGDTSAPVVVAEVKPVRTRSAVRTAVQADCAPPPTVPGAAAMTRYASGTAKAKLPETR
eukprot:366474-Chlamydomonas_euryale.AAC.20